MDGHIRKYSLLEIERRMLVRADLLPDLRGLIYKTIEDRYLDAGRLRLRKVTQVGATESTFKLCKKYGRVGTYEEPIVNIYLTAQEYEGFRHLPGSDILKRRYSYEFQGHDFSIDEHTDALAGLYLCEYEVTSAAVLNTIVVPSFAIEDVTADARFFGANLAHSKQWR